MARKLFRRKGHLTLKRQYFNTRIRARLPAWLYQMHRCFTHGCTAGAWGLLASRGPSCLDFPFINTMILTSFVSRSMSTLLFYSPKKAVTRENESSEGFSQPAQNDTEEGIELSRVRSPDSWPTAALSLGPAASAGECGHRGLLPWTEECSRGKGASPLPRLLSEGRVLCSPAEDTVPGVNIHTLMGGWG